MKAIDLVLRGEHITLDALLKSTGLATSGGAAKVLIGEGKVQVDGREELRKTCKLRAGQVVRIGEARVRVLAPLACPETDVGPSESAISDRARPSPDHKPSET